MMDLLPPEPPNQTRRPEKHSEGTDDSTVQMSAEQYSQLMHILEKTMDARERGAGLETGRDEKVQVTEVAKPRWLQWKDRMRVWATSTFKADSKGRSGDAYAGTILPDSLLHRWWDGVQLFAFAWSAVWLAIWHQCGDADGTLAIFLWDVELVMEPIISVLFSLDVVVNLRTVYTGEFDELISDKQLIFRRYLRRTMCADIVSAVPVHLVAALATGRRLGGTWALLHATRLLRLPRVRGLFEAFQGVGRHIDARYVDLYFTWVPKVRIVVGCLVCLHLLAFAKTLVSAHFGGAPEEAEGGYWRALFWNWAVLTTAPITVGVEGTADGIFCITVLVLSQVMQGVVVGKMSLLLLRDDIEGMNQARLRDMLTMLRHYSVPLIVQNEVLSYHHYNMQENVAASAADLLQGLPPQMEREIQLYIKLNLVGRVPMFRRVNEDLRIILARMLREETVEAGAVVVRAGDAGNEMYFLAYGSAEVLVGEQMVAVATLTKGNFFGEIALLEHCHRTATIVAVTYCHLYVLDKPVFQYIMQTFPDFGQEMRKEQQQRAEAQAKERAAREAASRRRSSAAPPPQRVEGFEDSPAGGIPDTSQNPLRPGMALHPAAPDPSRFSRHTSNLSALASAAAEVVFGQSPQLGSSERTEHASSTRPQGARYSSAEQASPLDLDAGNTDPCAVAIPWRRAERCSLPRLKTLPLGSIGSEGVELSRLPSGHRQRSTPTPTRAATPSAAPHDFAAPLRPVSSPDLRGGRAASFSLSGQRSSGAGRFSVASEASLLPDTLTLRLQALMESHRLATARALEQRLHAVLGEAEERMTQHLAETFASLANPDALALSLSGSGGRSGTRPALRRASLSPGTTHIQPQAHRRATFAELLQQRAPTDSTAIPSTLLSPQSASLQFRGAAGQV
eukprot:TRINITY_DN10797_c0_g1_i2.p1 TRINITY_DN10797_c0_g1~~TRINITY_DN10797_c0_g1_i2.p1  ORF type:complete len:941 (+),score=248.03 TRINITY_DN10797_c0_g1_i2:109-2823(+)